MELITSYNTHEIIMGYVERDREDYEGDDFNEDDAYEQRAQDSDIFDFEIEYVCEAFGEALAELDKQGRGYYYAEVKNFGWRNTNGFAFLYADGKTGIELGKHMLRKILPDTDCHFKIYRDGDVLKIQNWHHDSPMGNEWYTIYPAYYCNYCGEAVRELQDFDGDEICQQCLEDEQAAI